MLWCWNVFVRFCDIRAIPINICLGWLCFMLFCISLLLSWNFNFIYYYENFIYNFIDCLLFVRSGRFPFVLDCWYWFDRCILVALCGWCFGIFVYHFSWESQVWVIVIRQEAGAKNTFDPASWFFIPVDVLSVRVVLFYVQYQPFEVFTFGVIYADGMVGGLC